MSMLYLTTQKYNCFLSSLLFKLCKSKYQWIGLHKMGEKHCITQTKVFWQG